MMIEKVTIPLGKNQSVSGIITIPDTGQTEKSHGFIFAHGAANDMHNSLIVSLAERLTQAGYITLRFNFLYKERGRKSPDSQKRLVSTWQSVFKYFTETSGVKTDQIVAVGKSMGGRVASQMVAQALLPVDRLIFLGYPLHSPGKKTHYGMPIYMIFTSPCSAFPVHGIPFAI